MADVLTQLKKQERSSSEPDGTLYIVLGMWVQNKLFKIMMILARLNLAFFVTMSNFFSNTLYEIYLDVLVIGEV